jgi:hypothetical protein
MVALQSLAMKLPSKRFPLHKGNNLVMAQQQWPDLEFL